MDGGGGWVVVLLQGRWPHSLLNIAKEKATPCSFKSFHSGHFAGSCGSFIPCSSEGKWVVGGTFLDQMGGRSRRWWVPLNFKLNFSLYKLLVVLISSRGGLDCCKEG